MKGKEYASSLKQMISGWKYLEEKYGHVYDFCG